MKLILEMTLAVLVITVVERIKAITGIMAMQQNNENGSN